jgi:hypothetical protein
LPCLQPPVHGGTEALDGAINRLVHVHSSRLNPHHGCVVKINGYNTPEPVAVGIAVNWSEDDSNALHTPRMARHDGEDPVLRVRSRLGADSGLITDHGDAVHV